MNNINKDFFHDVINKLAKVVGYSQILKSEIGENPMLLKIESSAGDVIEMISVYRASLEKKDQEK